MEVPDMKRRYTQEEKKQLLANLDIEVEHRVRQFEGWLADSLENFKIHQEGQISRVPKLVRNLTMREFGEKYDGDMQAALKGMQRERMGGADAVTEIDKTTRKRKWVASQEAEAAAAAATAAADGSRNPKNARLMSASPKKKPGSSTGPGTAQRARLVSTTNKTPGTSRTMGRVPASPSPAKPSRPPNSHSRPASPTKPARATRPPSTSTFNPLLPKTPGYPFPTGTGKPGTARAPKRHESMLSVNGSPIANPYELGMEWFADGGDDDDEEEQEINGEEGRRKRANSIIVRRDPSFSLQAAPFPNGKGLHSRTNSQSNLLSSQSTTSQSSQPNHNPKTPRAPTRLENFGLGTALVTIPTKDGHLLEFDPLQTSPGTLDALEGISDSAKKQAKEEMGRLVQTALSKWKI